MNATMHSVVIRPESRDAWLQLRHQGVGSSEIGTLAGLNPYETPYQLWRRRVGIDPPIPETPAMRLGHLLEGAVAQLWQDATGREILPESEGDWIVRCQEKPWLQVSPDRTYLLPEDPSGARQKGILECKTTQRAVDPENLPPWWFCQIQYQLGVAGIAHGSLAWLSQGRDFGYKDIAFAPDFFEWLAGLADTFMNVNVRGNLPPDMQRGEDAMLRFPKETPDTAAEASPDTHAAWLELKRLRDEIKALEEKKTALEDTIKLAMGPADTLRFQGLTLATWRAPKPSTRLDTKALKADHPDLFAQYSTETSATRRLLIK